MWYIEYLLKNREEIRLSNDLDSDLFNDLLIVEREIKRFLNSGLISDKELEILEVILNSRSLLSAQDKAKYRRATMSKIFKGTCQKLSLSLGGIFTDEGYIQYMIDKYNLKDEEIKKLSAFIQSKYRQKIMKKSYRETK